MSNTIICGHIQTKSPTTCFADWNNPQNAMIICTGKIIMGQTKMKDIITTFEVLCKKNGCRMYIMPSEQWPHNRLETLKTHLQDLEHVFFVTNPLVYNSFLILPLGYTNEMKTLRPDREMLETLLTTRGVSHVVSNFPPAHIIHQQQLEIGYYKNNIPTLMSCTAASILADLMFMSEETRLQTWSFPFQSNTKYLINRVRYYQLGKNNFTNL